MNAKTLLILMLSLFAVPWAMWGQQALTINDGTQTNLYVPVNGYNSNSYNVKSQFISLPLIWLVCKVRRLPN